MNKIDELEEQLGIEIGFGSTTFDAVFAKLREQEAALQAADELAKRVNDVISWSHISHRGYVEMQEAWYEYRNASKGDK